MCDRESTAPEEDALQLPGVGGQASELPVEPRAPGHAAYLVDMQGVAGDQPRQNISVWDAVENLVAEKAPDDHAARPIDQQGVPREQTRQDSSDSLVGTENRVAAAEPSLAARARRRVQPVPHAQARPEHVAAEGHARAIEADKLVKYFLSVSLATIAARMILKTIQVTCVHVMLPTNDPMSRLHAGMIQAGILLLMGLMAPIIMLCACGEPSHACRRACVRCAPIVAQQMTLVGMCLPLIFSWSWNDVVKEALEEAAIRAIVGKNADVKGTAVGLAVCLAIVLTSFAICLRVVTSRLLNDSEIFNMFSLVVGYAWNKFLRRGWELVAMPIVMKSIGSQGKAPPPFVVFAVAAFYFFIIWKLVPLLLSNGGQGRVVPESVASRAKHVVESTFDSTLHFVYAWAQLHCLNMFFFNYLRDCKPDECGRADHFNFAIGVTIASIFLTKELEDVAPWCKELLSVALSLNTGDAWSNFCDKALEDADGLERKRSYILCTLFVWACMSYLDRVLEKVIRAREEDNIEGADDSFLGRTPSMIGMSTRDMDSEIDLCSRGEDSLA